MVQSGSHAINSADLLRYRVLIVDSRSTSHQELELQTSHEKKSDSPPNYHGFGSQLSLTYLAWQTTYYWNLKPDYWARRSLIYNIITPAPISPSTFKDITWSKLIGYWQTRWDSLVRIKTQLTIGSRETSYRPIRREEIALCRLRTNITRLAYTDPKIINDYPAICEECNEVLNVKHILIDWLLYHRERRPMKEYLATKHKRFVLLIYYKMTKIW